MSYMLRRFGLVGGVAIALIDSTASVHAAEQLYFRGGQWEVALSSPDGASGTENAFCEARTTTWAAKRFSARYELTGLDVIATSFRLQKDGWGLPDGQSTKVTLNTSASPLAEQFDFKVSDPNTLRADADYLEGAGIISLGLGSTWNPKLAASLNIAFEGNEPPWVVPSSKPIELYQLKTAFAECRTALVALGGPLFARADSAGKPPTSPFTPLAENGAAAQVSSARNAAEPGDATAVLSSTWKFSESETDWGHACYLATQRGDVKVGFMGTPGEDFVGYVEGVFQGETRATWSIDSDPPNVSDGAQSDYSGWLEFDDLPVTILDEIANGSKLAVTDRTGKRVTVGLNGARTAVPAFKQCFGAMAPQSAVSSGSSAASNDHGKKTVQSCLLEVDGKKVIDGACKWGPYSGDGASLVMEANGYFAIVYRESERKAYGYWNGGQNAGHAHTNLGELTKSKYCWHNSRVEMCFRN